MKTVAAQVARVGDREVGSGDQEAAGARQVVVDGDEPDLDLANADRLAICHAGASRRAPGQVARGLRCLAELLHAGRVVERYVGVEKADQARVVEVEVRDEHLCPPVPAVASVDAVQRRG